MSEKKEIRIKGRAVSRGFAVGRAVCLYGERFQFYRQTIDESQRTFEFEKLERAITTTRLTLEADITSQINRGRTTAADILQSHRLILDDPSITERLSGLVHIEGMNAESAVQIAYEELADRLRSIKESSISEKALDVNDVRDRLLSAFDLKSQSSGLPPDSIVFAKEISPSKLLELLENGVLAIAAESGGWTSHTSILARESHLPAVTGIHQIMKQVTNGQPVIVDGDAGELIIDPTASTIEWYDGKGSVGSEFAATPKPAGEKFETLDGVKIIIRTNTVSLDAYKKAIEVGAAGIGLYRSESLIGKYKRIPTEAEQAKEYAAFAEITGEHGVRIRTFDIDAERSSDFSDAFQKNPALGLRAIRLGLKDRTLLETQIRALLRAASKHELGIVVPMVSGTYEIEEVRKIITEESKRLKDYGIQTGTPKLGAMIEIPSAVLVIDQIADACDFLCLGTNDLAQYLLAADRDNEAVSKWFRTLHPAMIRAVKSVIDGAGNANKPLTICGEMAGSPFYVPILIGLGATELSINPSAIEAVSRVISGITLKAAAELVNEIAELKTADEVEAVVASAAKSKWHHLFAPGFLEMQNP